MSILLFLLVLVVLILVHEWGHFIVAKKTGMRVDEFGIGFPPKLFGVKRGETEYTLNALPLGGFVRIYGENPSPEDKESSDAARAMNNRPRWAQALVLVAGVTMNVLFAWALFVAVFMIGVQTLVEEETASDSAQLYVAEVLEGSPLFEQVPPGAVVTAVRTAQSELQSLTPSTFREFVQAQGEAPIDITFVQAGVEETITVVPVVGLIPESPDRLAVGASLALIEVQRQSFFSALVSASTATYNGLIAITVGLGTLITQALVGTADFSQVAGPIGIVGLVGDAASFGFSALLMFTAMISLNLAVINMLPFPALDGGRLLFVAIESVTKRTINPVWSNRLNLAGFALLMVLMAVVTYNDILKLL